VLDKHIHTNIVYCWYIVLVDFDHSPTQLSDKAVPSVIQHRSMKVHSGGKGSHFNVGTRTQWAASHPGFLIHHQLGRVHLKCDGTRAETRFRLSAKRTVHLNRRGRQFSRLLAAEVCASAVVMLYKPCSKVVWRVQATHCIRQFPLHSPSRASPCAITFQLDSTCVRPTGAMSVLEKIKAVASTRNLTQIPRSSSQWPNHQFQCSTVAKPLSLLAVLRL